MKSSVLEYYLLRIIKGGPCDLVEGIPEALALGYIFDTGECLEDICFMRKITDVCN